MEMPLRETLKQAKYTYVRFLGDKAHLLKDENGQLEVWFANKNHASWGLTWKNTHLEFVRRACDSDLEV